MAHTHLSMLFQIKNTSKYGHIKHIYTVYEGFFLKIDQNLVILKAEVIFRTGTLKSSVLA